MKFIDLDGQYRQLKPKIDQAVLRVLDHGKYVFGPEIQQLEAALSEYIGVQHTVAMNSGTAALEVALLALGVGPGDEVITTAYSFFATAEVIARVGAVPVLVDIHPETYNINETLIESVITDKTKAIMPVSLYGQPANYRVINQIAEKYGLPVIEDGAQSFGATHHGQRSCGLTTIGCTSFFPSKPLGCYGDGGACFTNDAELAETMRCLINHGQRERYVHDVMGCNGRMATIQAAILLEKLAVFEQEVSQRQVVAQWYEHALPQGLVKPVVTADNTSVYGQYTVRVTDRAGVQEKLHSHGIPTAVHYPMGMHQQPAMKPYPCAALSFPHTEAAANVVMSLPFYPAMQQSDVEQVSHHLEKILKEGVKDGTVSVS